MCQRGTDTVRVANAQSGSLPHDPFTGPSKPESFEVILDTGTPRDTPYNTK